MNSSWARVTFVLLGVPVKIDWVLFTIPFILVYCWKPKYRMRGLGLLIGMVLHELAHLMMLGLFGIGVSEMGAGFLYAYVAPTVPLDEMFPAVALLVTVAGPTTNFVLGRVLSGDMADVNSTLGYINILPFPGMDGFFALYAALACVFPGVGYVTTMMAGIALLFIVLLIPLLIEWKKARQL